MTEKLAELFDETCAQSRNRAARRGRLHCVELFWLAGSAALRPFALCHCCSRRRLTAQRRTEAGRAHRNPVAADRELRSARSGAHALRRAGIPRRPGIVVAAQGFRRPVGDQRWRRTATTFIAVTDKAHWLRGRIVYRGDSSGRHRRCRDRADARTRRPPARRARLVRHRVARRGRRHALCRHRARAPDREIRLRQVRSAGARRRSCRVPPEFAKLPENKRHRMPGRGAEAGVRLPAR